MYWDKSDTENQVADIIKELFPRAKDSLSKSVYDSPITGQPLYLNGLSFVYLLFEIEKRLQVKFSEEDLIDYRCYTVELIAERIYEKSRINASDFS